jgi:hypothetical protein
MTAKLWVIDGLQHDIQPDPATARREVDGEPIAAAVLAEWDAYPVLALCLFCHEPIRCKSLYSQWFHWEAVE